MLTQVSNYKDKILQAHSRCGPFIRDLDMSILKRSSSWGASLSSRRVQALFLPPLATSLNPRDNLSGDQLQTWSVVSRAVSTSTGMNHVLPAQKRWGRGPQAHVRKH